MSVLGSLGGLGGGGLAALLGSPAVDRALGQPESDAWLAQAAAANPQAAANVPARLAAMQAAAFGGGAPPQAAAGQAPVVGAPGGTPAPAATPAGPAAAAPGMAGAAPGFDPSQLSPQGQAILARLGQPSMSLSGDQLTSRTTNVPAMQDLLAGRDVAPNTLLGTETTRNIDPLSLARQMAGNRGLTDEDRQAGMTAYARIMPALTSQIAEQRLGSQGAANIELQKQAQNLAEQRATFEMSPERRAEQMYVQAKAAGQTDAQALASAQGMVNLPRLTGASGGTQPGVLQPPPGSQKRVGVSETDTGLSFRDQNTFQGKIDAIMQGSGNVEEKAGDALKKIEDTMGTDWFKTHPQQVKALLENSGTNPRTIMKAVNRTGLTRVATQGISRLLGSNPNIPWSEGFMRAIGAGGLEKRQAQLRELYPFEEQ